VQPQLPLVLVYQSQVPEYTMQAVADHPVIIMVDQQVVQVVAALAKALVVAKPMSMLQPIPVAAAAVAVDRLFPVNLVKAAPE
jgi:hypothetical protein